MPVEGCTVLSLLQMTFVQYCDLLSMIENNNQATSDTQEKKKSTTKALRNETAFQGHENLSKRKYITQIFTKSAGAIQPFSVATSFMS